MWSKGYSQLQECTSIVPSTYDSSKSARKENSLSQREAKEPPSFKSARSNSS